MSQLREGYFPQKPESALSEPKGRHEFGSTQAEWAMRYGGTPHTIAQAESKILEGNFSSAFAHLASLQHADKLITDIGKTLTYDNPGLKQRMLIWWLDENGEKDWHAARTRIEAEETLNNTGN